MSEKVRYAVIGCGNISGAHLGGYQALGDRVEPAYFIDIDIAKAEARKEKYGAPQTVCLTDYREMLRDDTVSCVSVCLPNYLHCPVTVDCLRAGKNVLCEKPAALNLAEALRMKAAADETGKILNIGVVNRFNAGVERLRERVLAGELGEVYQIYCSFRAHRSIPGMGGWFTTKALSGGGALIDWGVHFLDLINYVVDNKRPTTVSAVCHSKLGNPMKDYVYRSMHAGPPDLSGTYDVEEYVTGLIRTEGPAINFNGAWAQNIDESAMFIEFMGTKAGAKLIYGDHFTLYGVRNGELYSETPEFDIPPMFHKEIACFIDSARKGEKIRSNIDNVLITAGMMDAIYASAEQGREVVPDLSAL